MASGRTNRLLDLLDPDELNAPKPAEKSALIRESAPQNAGAEGKGQGKTSNEKLDDAPPSQNSTDSALDLIRKTARLFIRNLSYTISEDEVREYFKSFGALDEVRIIQLS